MSVPTLTAEPVYFGKVPSRGDFVRSSGQALLVQLLDRWLTSSMEALSTDARWKLIYDAAPALWLAVLGAQSPLGLAAYLQVSRDSSDRRFPFVSAVQFATPDPARGLVHGPVELLSAWFTLERASRSAVESPAFDDSAVGLLRTPVPVPDARLELPEWDPAHGLGRIGDVQDAIRRSGHRGFDVRCGLIALGLLLRPLLTPGAGRLSKGLVLPVPRDPVRASDVASLWMLLVAPFIARTDAEIVLALTRTSEAPVLVLGFNGATPEVLRAALDPEARALSCVALDAAEWVEAQIRGDGGLRKLSNYLEDPDLPTQQAVSTFREVFLGL